MGVRPRRVSRIHPRRPCRPRRPTVHRRRPLRLRSRRPSRRRRSPNRPLLRGAPDPRSTATGRPRRSSRRGRRRCLLGPRTDRPRTRVHLSPRCPQTSHRAKTTATAHGHRTHWHRGMHPLIHSSPRRQSLLRLGRRRSPRTRNYPTRTTKHTNRRRRRTARTSTPHSAASPSADQAGPRWGPKTRRCGR
jgi:hypothetical protein